MTTGRIRTGGRPPAASRRRTRVPTWAAVLVSFLSMLACRGSSTDNEAALRPSTSTALVTVPPQSPTTAPGPPATRGPKAIVFGPITFHAPSTWDIYIGEPATTAYIGVLAGGPPDVEIRVMTDYTGTVDALQPTDCLEYPPETPNNVQLVDSGFAPVGSLSAEYRMWRFSCPRNKTEEHRVWLLPVSHIAIVEQNHRPEVIDVVKTAEVI